MEGQKLLTPHLKGTKKNQKSNEGKLPKTTSLRQDRAAKGAKMSLETALGTASPVAKQLLVQRKNFQNDNKNKA